MECWCWPLDVCGPRRRQRASFVVRRYRIAFEKFDADGSRFIELDELAGALRHLGLDASHDHCVTMMRRFDVDGNGKLDFDEFKTLAVEVLFAAGTGDGLFVAKATMMRQLEAAGFARRAGSFGRRRLRAPVARTPSRSPRRRF